MDGKKGADDTYLFDGAQPPSRDRERPAEMSAPPSKSEPEYQVPGTPLSPPTPANAYQTPGIFRADSGDMDESMDTGDTTSALETMSSSPTAAAAARTVSRAISMASAGGFDASYDGDDYSQEPTDNEDDIEATPRKKKGNSLTESSDNQSTLKDDTSNRSQNTSFGDAGSTPGMALLNRKSSGRRLRDREGGRQARGCQAEEVRSRRGGEREEQEDQLEDVPGADGRRRHQPRDGRGLGVCHAGARRLRRR